MNPEENEFITNDGVITNCLVCNSIEMEELNKYCDKCGCFFRSSLNHGGKLLCITHSGLCTVNCNQAIICPYCRFIKIKLICFNETGNLVLFSNKFFSQTPSISVEEIFASTIYTQPWFSNIKLFNLQRIMISLESYFSKCSSNTKDRFYISTEVIKQDYIRYMEKNCLYAAQFLMLSNEFANLSMGEKFQISDNFLAHFFVITNAKMVQNIFESSAYYFIIDKNRVYELKYDQEAEEATANSSGKLKVSMMIKRIINFYITHIYTVIQNFGTIEFSYLMTLLIWTNKSDTDLNNYNLYLKKSSVYTPSNIVIANCEIHDYYVNELNVTSYESRIMEMYKLIQCSIEFNKMKKQMLELCKELEVYEHLDDTIYSFLII